MMNIVSIFLITDINFLFSGFWGKMNDGSYRAVSTITREQAPKEAHLNTVGIPASLSGKKGFIVKSEFLVAIIFVEMKSEGTETLLAQNRLWKKKIMCPLG